MIKGKRRVVHGSGRPTGWVWCHGSGWVEILQFSMGWIGLDWIEYDKSTIVFDDYTTSNCKGPCKLNTGGGYEKLAFFDQHLSKTVQDTAIITMEDH